MIKVSTIGLDLAKNVFQVHGISDDGTVGIRRRLRRAEVVPFFSRLPPCLVGMEACATSHYWARELGRLGHEIRMIPPRYVKPYVKRGKNDALDAEAICEAVQRPSMRFVPLKTAEQQGALVIHKTRDLLVRQRAILVNALRSHLAEFGIIVAKDIGNAPQLAAVVRDKTDRRVPATARSALVTVVDSIDALSRRIKVLETRIRHWHRANLASQRLATIPGIGPITATAIAATVPDPKAFRSGRHFAAWLGLTPRQNSTGGKERVGGISKQGNTYIRRLLFIGAVGVVRYARRRSPLEEWIRHLLERRPTRLVTIALANKLARIAWAVLAHDQNYRAGQPVAA
jgi:transposase